MKEESTAALQRLDRYAAAGDAAHVCAETAGILCGDDPQCLAAPLGEGLLKPYGFMPRTAGNEESLARLCRVPRTALLRWWAFFAADRFLSAARGIGLRLASADAQTAGAAGRLVLRRSARQPYRTEKEAVSDDAPL